jgi:hypothetical protein
MCPAIDSVVERRWGQIQRGRSIEFWILVPRGAGLDFGLKRKKPYPNHNPRSVFDFSKVSGEITTQIQDFER